MYLLHFIIVRLNIILIILFIEFQLGVCITLHTTNLKNNPDYRKTPTLDATITLTDDGLKRTNFITDSGSKTHVIIQNVYSLVTEDIEKCFTVANVSL